MDYKIPYGKASITLTLTGSQGIDIVLPREEPASKDPLMDVKAAIQSPIGISLEDHKDVRSVAIGINDKTRPVPHEYLLPPLLDVLRNNGLPPKNIHLIIASGLHQPMKVWEYISILPREIVVNFPISVHDCDHSPMIALGTTSRGTPVLVNRDFFMADLKITIGNIEPHHFMGFSGGAKTAAIGLTSRKTINKNHSHIMHHNAITGHYEDNPMRQDVEEIGKMIGVHFVVNAILTTNKEIIRVIVGDPEAVMISGIQLSRAINQAEVHVKYDLVIVAPGGYPKDINFYQSQKALTHAGMITKEGGDILLMAECIEGVGNSGYERLIHSVASHAEVMEYFKTNDFEVGPHKAYLVARDGLTKKIHLYSSMPEPEVKKLLLDPIADPQSFIDTYLTYATDDCRIAILPFGTTTIPKLIL